MSLLQKKYQLKLFLLNPGQAAWIPDLDQYPYDVAKQWIQEGLTGPDCKHFLKKNKRQFPYSCA